MPTARSNALAGVLAGQAVVIGGYSTVLGGNLSTVEIYDPVADAWCSGPPKPTPASEFSVAETYTADAIHAIGSGIGGAAMQVHEALVLTSSAPAAAAVTPPAVCAGVSHCSAAASGAER